MQDICFFPKHSHEEAFKKFGRYLKLTRDRGLILNPNREIFNIDIYPDADFSSMYGHKKPTNPVCVKSCTSYIITFSDCPILCQSKVQTETSLSNTEAEIIDLAHNCREFFPVIDKTKSLGKLVVLTTGETQINVYIHKDNSGALVLANTLPPQFTHQSKNYAANTI